MHALLASLLLLAAGEAPPPAPVLPDAEVIKYLKPSELAEWSNAQRTTLVGQQRLRQGNSIMGTIRTPDPKAIKSGGAGLSETPEQTKARAQKIIDEGNAQIQQAMPSLTRLRAVAGARLAEKTKPIDFSSELPQGAWGASVSQAVVRLQKQARDAGFAKTHLVGAVVVQADGKLVRTSTLSDDLRAAWVKADAKSLAAAPAEGYAYAPAADSKTAPTFSKGVSPATAARQTAVLWAEFYALPSEGSLGLLFVRLADAYTMRVVASEAFLTSPTAVDAGAAPKMASAVFRDQRSFVPRLAASGDWVFAFDRESSALGSAVLTHAVVQQTKLGIAASPYLVVVTGAGVPSLDGVRAHWRVVPGKAEKPDPKEALFQVAATPVGAASTEVGRVVLRVDDAPKPAAK
jgi:hypothetical protein